MHPSVAVVRVAPRQQLFALLCLLGIAALWVPCRSLLALCLEDERYTYIILVPVISAAFLYLDRERILRDARYCPSAGVPLMVLGLAIAIASQFWLAGPADLTLAAGTLVLLWIGAFISCYGMISVRRAGFPLVFLLLTVPIPRVVLDGMVTGLQAGSAEVSFLLFRAAHVPVFRRGMVMSLPGVDIEVAPQCSGIRSTMALFIASVVVSRVLLRLSWTRALVILSVAPIAIFRNSVRIVCISLLGVYADRQFLFGRLHRYGGLPFSLVGFAILIPLVWLLGKCERRLGADRAPQKSAAPLR